MCFDPSVRLLFAVSLALLSGACRARAAPAPAPVAPVAVPAPVAWRALASGVDAATLTSADGVTQILLTRFDLTLTRAEVAVGAGWPPRPETAAALRRRVGALAVVNGGFFDERRAPLGLRVADGKTRAPLRKASDWGVLCLDAQRARIVHTRELPADAHARGAIQVGPRLVVDGAPLALKPQRARRTAVALDRAGRHLTLVIVDSPIDANDLAARLAAAGFDTALALDGGPSTQLALEIGDTHVDLPGGYPVPDLLVLKPTPR